MKDIIPLTLVRAGETVIVAQLTAADPTELRKMTLFGVFPGVMVQVLQTTPAYVLRIAFTELAIDQRLARQIWVRKG